MTPRFVIARSHPFAVSLLEASAWTDSRKAAQLGGKGASLARLSNASFPVPAAFVVTTAAYEHASVELLQGLTNVADLRERLAGAALPSAIISAVSAAWRALVGDEPGMRLAVRSSALGEDGDDHSFAGQQSSFLGVVGLESVLEHTRLVWASLFGDEATVYRARLSPEVVPPRIAVVVQKMVAPRSAGVCFTVNPVSRSTGELVVSSSWGLGTSVVDGDSADTYYLRKPDGVVLRRELAVKSNAVVMSADGGTEVRANSGQEGAESSLSDAELSRVAVLGRQIEDFFGAPQDIEWAIENDGGLWAIQSRPVTGQVPAAAPAVWTNVNVGEALPGVGSPMTWSIIRSFSRMGFERAFRSLGLDVPNEYELVDAFYGRVYLNLTQFAAVITQIPLLKPETLINLAGGPSPDAVEGTYQRQSSKQFLQRLPGTAVKIAASQVTTPFLARRWAKKFRKQRAAFFKRPLNRLTEEELGPVLDELDEAFEKTGLIMLSAASNFLASYAATKWLLGHWGGDEAAGMENTLFSGLTELRSAEPGFEIMRMAKFVRRHTKLEAYLLADEAPAIAARFDSIGDVDGGRALLSMIDDFMTQYGHRAPGEAELATPRWHEDPTFVINVLQTYLRAPFLPDPQTLAEERRRLRIAATESIRPHFKSGLGIVFRQVLGVAQEGSRLREDLRACVIDTLSMYRHFFLEVGHRLTRKGELSTPADVFFLTKPEIRRMLAGDKPADLSIRVAVRRQLTDHFRSLPDPAQTFLLKDGRIAPAEPLPVAVGDLLSGLPGSPGRVTGRARVIHQLDADTTLAPGDILVAPFTDVGWTPLFLAAGGVVMDRGGPLSHSCIVAREYGIPAAVNVKLGTSLIEDGDIITVDGDAGCVYLPRKEAAAR